MNKIGGSNRVRDELTAAFAEGRGVTAKVRWVSKYDEEGRNKWIHCTPLIGANGQVGVWMVVIVDEQKSGREWAMPRQAPSCAHARSQSDACKDEEWDRRIMVTLTQMAQVTALIETKIEASAGSGSLTSLRIG